MIKGNVKFRRQRLEVFPNPSIPGSDVQEIPNQELVAGFQTRLDPILSFTIYPQRVRHRSERAKRIRGLWVRHAMTNGTHLFMPEPAIGTSKLKRASPDAQLALKRESERAAHGRPICSRSSTYEP